MSAARRGVLLVAGLGGLAAFLAAVDGSVLFLALPAIARDFQARVPALSYVGTVVALGGLGALPLSALADRHGRRRVIALGVAGFSAANLASAFAPGLGWLAGWRAAAACCEALVAGVTTAFVIEESPAGRRAVAAAWLALAAGLGAGVTTLAYPLVAPHWRTLYLAGGLGLAGAAAIWAWMPEGETWTRAVAVDGRATVAESLGLLFASPWRRRLLLFMAAAALGAILYEPAGLFLAYYGSRRLGLSPGAISVVVVASGLAAAAGFAAGGLASDRVGRRALGVALTAGTAVLTGAAFTSGAAGYWVGNVLGSLLAGASAPVLGAWFAELVPTRVRATGEGAVSVAATAGGVFGLQVVGLAVGTAGLGRALAALAAPALVGASLYLGLPETKGQALAD